MNELLFPPIDELASRAEPEPTSGFVCFVLDEQRYGVAVDGVREVLRPTELAWVPGAPAACLGVVNLRGRIVCVLDLRQMLGRKGVQANESSRLLVIDHAQNLVALLVDKVLDLSTFKRSEIELTPRLNHGPGPVDGVVTRPDGPVFLLKPEQLLAELKV